MTLMSTSPDTASADEQFNLDQLPVGTPAIVSTISGADRVRRRLLEMGLCPGTPITVLRKAPLGDPIVVDVLGYQLGLRRQQAAAIGITTTQPEAATNLPAEPTALSGQTVDGSVRRIALVGNPNSGKTTLFNALTGLHQQVGNYPGITVERRIGHYHTDGGQIDIIDLPGTYSLTPNSPDERIAVDVVLGRLDNEPLPDALVVVMDASNLARNLLLFTQLADRGLPMVVALTMCDIAARRGRSIKHDRLAQILGVPVVPLIAHRGYGVDDLRAAIPQAAVTSGRPWPLHQGHRDAITWLVAELGGHLPGDDAAACAERLLVGADSLVDYAKTGDELTVVKTEQARHQLPAEAGDPIEADIISRYAWIQAVTGACRDQNAQAAKTTISDRLDRLLVHRVAGLGIFAVIMYSVFFLIYTVADPFMGMFEDGIAALGDLAFGGLADGALKSLLLDGVIGGVGGVVVFVPQIAMLFLCIALLEQSGYLSRAAFLLDRLLAAVGLHGKSFIPMLSSHACAIPGIMAARGIENRRDRLATMFVSPFMSCGARLPVYALLIGVFLASYGGTVQSLVLFGCYTLGIVAAVLVAWGLKKTALSEPPAAFLLELPAYRLPVAKQVTRVVLRNSWLFVRKAGTVILGFSILLWAALYYPRLDEAAVNRIMADHGLSAERYEAGLVAGAAIAEAEAAAEEAGTALDEQAIAAIASEAGSSVAEVDAATAIDNAIGGAQVEQSFAGTGGKLLEPVIAPMGYDWKIGIGLIGAFAAREVFVGTMGVVYSVGEADESSDSLHAAMQADTRADGTPVWTMATVASVLVFFVLAMQCISTVAVMKAETGGWRWPMAQMAVMSGIAYIAATIVYQVGSLFS